MDSNYNDDTAADDLQSELTNLRLKNHALQLLLREHLNKFVSVQEEENGDEVSSTQRTLPTKKNTIPLASMVQNQTKAQSKGRVAEKVKAVYISTPEVLVVPQRQSVFERISEKDSGPKVWVENDLRRLINFTVAGKAVPL